MNCKNCPYGPRNPCSDYCDGCQNDEHTGWGGFTDHRLKRDFKSESDRELYIDLFGFEDLNDDEDGDDWLE